MYSLLFALTVVSSINCYVVSKNDDTLVISVDASPVKVNVEDIKKVFNSEM